MRSIRDSGQSLFDFSPLSYKTTDMVKALEQIVAAIPDSALYAINADLQENTKNPDVGATGMSAQQVLRMALIKQMEGLSFRDLHLRVEDSICLRRFAGYEFTMVQKKSALQQNIAAIHGETWELINHAVVKLGIKLGIDDPGKIRIDTTNTQTDIHHPTDASLLNDGIRVLCRLNASAKESWQQLNVTFHDRTRAGKKILFKINNAKSADIRLKLYRSLVALAEKILGYSKEVYREIASLSFADATEVEKARDHVIEMKEIWRCKHCRVKFCKVVMRRRLRSIIQDLMYLASRLIKHARQWCLEISERNLWYDGWKETYFHIRGALPISA